MKAKHRNIAASLVVAVSAFIAAWKGSLDWMGLAVLAAVFKLPGTQWLRDMIGGKVKNKTGKDNE